MDFYSPTTTEEKNLSEKITKGFFFLVWWLPLPEKGFSRSRICYHSLNGIIWLQRSDCTFGMGDVLLSELNGVDGCFWINSIMSLVCGFGFMGRKMWPCSSYHCPNSLALFSVWCGSRLQSTRIATFPSVTLCSRGRPVLGSMRPGCLQKVA